MRSVIPALMALALAACAAPEPRIESMPDAGVLPPGAGAPGVPEGQEMWPQGEPAPTLQTDRQHYAVGATMQLRLHNASSQPIGYNLCTAGLQRRDGGGWTAVQPDDRVCTMELRTLEPNAQTTYAYELPANLPAGEYRVIARLERMREADMRGVVSAPFHVGGHAH